MLDQHEEKYPERILRKADVEKVSGFKARHILTMEQRGDFPRRFQPDPASKVVGWLESEVISWAKARAASRGAGA